MPSKAPASGPFAVGILALQDRVFFERLLKDPRKALTDGAFQNQVTLTAAELEEVVRLVQQGGQQMTLAKALEMWDGYHNRPEWGGGWNSWPPERIAGRPQPVPHPGPRSGPDRSRGGPER